MDIPLTLVDTHVHIYHCFPFPKLLDSAQANFMIQARRFQSGTPMGVLVLTESQGTQWFDRLVDADPVRRSMIAVLCRQALAVSRPAFVIANNKAEGSSPLTLFRLAERVLQALA